jgi:hypothetical protein
MRSQTPYARHQAGWLETGSGGLFRLSANIRRPASGTLISLNTVERGRILSYNDCTPAL